MLVAMLGARAQEYCFSQYYLDKLSVNPAFASVGDYSEVGAIFRDQWPGVDNGFKIFAAEYQQKLAASSSAVGARAYGDISGGAYKTAALSAIYAYDFHVTYNIKCSIGMEMGYYSKSLSQSDLVYYSMIDPATGSKAPLNDFAEYGRHSGINFSTGAIFYTKKLLAGIAVVRFANQSLSGSSNVVPTAITAIANYKILLGTSTTAHKIDEIFVVPTIVASHSSVSDMIMPGVYFSGKKILLGMGWRYMMSEFNASALAVSVGFNFGDIELGFGHDFDMGPISKSKGSTEVGLKYKFENSQKKKGSKTILCPAF